MSFMNKVRHIVELLLYFFEDTKTCFIEYAYFYLILFYLNVYFCYNQIRLNLLRNSGIIRRISKYDLNYAQLRIKQYFAGDIRTTPQMAKVYKQWTQDEKDLL